MDFTKLEGLLSAIEGESLQPSPSHNNLSRLVALFMRELLVQLTPPCSETVTDAGNPESALEEPEKHPKHKKAAKRSAK